jgi:hypothetical protein
MVLAGGGASLAVAAAPAGASNTEMTAAGSFTTFFMVHALFPEVNDLNPLPPTGTESQSISVDSKTCSLGATYSVASGVNPPNGSGAGKTALFGEESAASTSQGCIDFARSSSPPAPTSEKLPSGTAESGDNSGSNFDYYAYALDGVAPLVGNDAPTTVRVTGSDVGPGNGLPLSTIQGIFECNITNWDQITINGATGANSPIVTFWPQKGSGTRAVMTDILGFDPTVPGTSPDNCNLNDQPIDSFGATMNGGNGTLAAGDYPEEENSEDGIIYQNSVGITNPANLAINCTGAPPCTSTGTATVPAGSVTNAAIYLFSAGKFSQEWNDTTDYNGTANNVVADFIQGNNTNTMGNWATGANSTPGLSMATVQDTSGSGEAYVDLTPQVGRLSDTNRGSYAMDGNTVAEANEWYHNIPSPSPSPANPSNSTALIPGIRYVYNVADTVLPGYNGAKMLMGFDNQANGTKSVLCNGDDASTITAQGFLPLTTGPGPVAASDAAGATCRQFGGGAFPSQGAVIHWTTLVFDNKAH